MLAISKLHACAALCGASGAGTDRFRIVVTDGDLSRAFGQDPAFCFLGSAKDPRIGTRKGFNDNINRLQTSNARGAPFLLFRTSGTTRAPRWVVHSESTLGASLTSRILGLAPGADESLDSTDLRLMERVALAPRVSCVSIATISGFTQLAHCLFLGTPIVLMPRAFPRLALRMTVQYGAGTVVTTPAILRLMLVLGRTEWLDAARLGVIGIGGGSLDGSIYSAVGQATTARIIQGYGSTEMGGAITNVRLWDPPEVRERTVGRGLDGLKIEIRDESGSTVPAGVSGQLCVNDPNRIALGYLNPQSGMTIDPIVLADGWYMTGDAATRDQHGNVTILGRLDDRINRGEEKFYPQEVEAVIESHPKIAHALVELQRSGEGIPSLLARCTLWTQEDSVSASEIRKWCRSRLRRSQCPDTIEFTDLETTVTDKVVRH
jgi:acyl-coenzyme A synthetase/AMP-(fatty) acid ligase